MHEPVFNDAQRCQFALIADSYERLTGRALIDSTEHLWDTPRVIVAHGMEDDPVFFYGNQMALQVFEMDFATFTRLPSRFSAEPVNREERAWLLARVSRDGFIDDYAGVRISASGKRFRIEHAVVWNLIDTDDRCHGQAATFDHWTSL